MTVNKRARKYATKWLSVNPSPLTRRLLWHLFSLDTSCIEEPEHHKSFEKPGVHLFWVVSGNGTLETQGHHYHLRPGNCVWFLDMMLPRTYNPYPGQKLVKRGIRFGGPGLGLWQEEFGGPKGAEFVVRDLSRFHCAFSEIGQIVKRKTAGWEWPVHIILTRVLGVLLSSRNLLSVGHVDLPPPVIQVLKAVGANPFYDWRVTDLVALSGVSYSGLRSIFSKTYHESLHHFLQRNRFDQARLLLSNPRFSVKQIAEQLHFSSEFYFSHFFKSLAGMSPSDFRDQSKIKN